MDKETREANKGLKNATPRGLMESRGILVNYIHTFHWLGRIRRSFRWVDKMETKGLFR